MAEASGIRVLKRFARTLARYRTATQWNAPGPLLRLHAGLESPTDLIADLEQGFKQLADEGTNSTT